MDTCLLSIISANRDAVIIARLSSLDRKLKRNDECLSAAADRLVDRQQNDGTQQ